MISRSEERYNAEEWSKIKVHNFSKQEQAKSILKRRNTR